MPGKKDDIRSQRSAALADKKRRLEELKARRSTRQLQQAAAGDSSSVASAATSVSASSAISASRNGNLDEYIDGLLNSSLPVGAPVVSPFMTTQTTATTAVDEDESSVAGTVTSSASASVSASVLSKGPETSSVTTAISTMGESVVLQQQKKKVETFEICTQTNEDDFPIPPLSDDDDGDDDEGLQDNDDDNKENGTETENTNGEATNESPRNNEMIEPKLLNEEEMMETISTNKFTSFFNSASKKVERYLGSSILSDLLVDDVMYYTDLQSKRLGASKSTSSGPSSSHSLVSAQVSFDYPKWTRGRDITSVDWSVHHRGEVLLASYHMSSSLPPSIGSTATSSLVPNVTPSSSLLPQSKSELTQADGLNIVWNLTMPHRPEHILTCGSPVLESKFHPTEGSLVVGACYSGQVVVWDVRSGRLPVQRSSLNLLSGSGGGGHVHPVVGMEVLDGGVRSSCVLFYLDIYYFASTLRDSHYQSNTFPIFLLYFFLLLFYLLISFHGLCFIWLRLQSGFVTAASDGTVNFWSLSNLIEPAESLKISGGNLTSIAVAPESQSIIAGDECGSMYAIVPSSTTTTSTTTTAGGSRSSSSNSRRTVRKLNDGKKDPAINDFSHYGPVTGLSTKVTSKVDKDGGVSLTRGFARGTRGMVLTCGVDWTTKLWAPAYSDKPLLNLLSHSYDYMCDVQW